MSTYKTQSGNEIDIEAVIEVLAGEREGKWFLDTFSGKVSDKQNPVYAVCIQSVSEKKILEIMIDFIESMCFEDNDPVSKALKNLLDNSENIVNDALAILRTNDSWMSGWITWRNEALWDDALDLLYKADPKIKEFIELDCTCPMCHFLSKDIERNGEDIEIKWDLSNVSGEKE